MLIDSHANLRGETYSDDLDAVLERARAAGVSPVIAICCRLGEFDQVKAIAEAQPDVWCTLGAHPHHAKNRPDISADELISMAGGHPKLVAFGETGLDLHYNYSPLDQQMASLRAHIEAARRTGLPVILHCREADQQMADLLEEEMGKGPFKALLHCYTGGEELARRASALGLWFSASGIITFKKADDVRAIFRDIIPADRVIIETDCPYLAPVPYRGQKNEPSFLPHVADKLAEIRGWTAEETAQRTTANCLTLFDRITVSP
ncbi:sec-independent protein translocase TatD [Glycocaulis alkaliphilus]|uniref:Sec-independent protein translocase TatD n=1 Tax=Glycocaulis alkaliphilus TaxID=1434191 RepID=A0A3T0EA74_9PROT|nr:TatD family hydrolase [Glycocaulis alkaliphilus]AZU04056.1 sec-independent protein translocase TatD [Glycocaulis alkaliphilus]GGB75451.1 LuxR family transcriptional regulator [Glycocaulis alkaliphilus]